MHNHYISQFVIKRFSGAINIFNIDSGEIDEKKRPHKVFFKEDIYDEETERLFNYIESRVANILDNKILKHDILRFLKREAEKCDTLTAREFFEKHEALCRAESEEEFNRIRNSIGKEV